MSFRIQKNILIITEKNKDIITDFQQILFNMSTERTEMTCNGTFWGCTFKPFDTEENAMLNDTVK